MLALQRDVAFDWQWVPHSMPELAQADLYSKEVDTGELRVHC